MNKEEYLTKLTESIDILGDILDTENYGMCIVNRDGYIVKWNYEKFFGIKESEALGRHVTEVLENTRLHLVAQSGEKELYQLQKIKGDHVITNRIPLIFQGEIMGAAGTIIFKDTKEIGELFNRMEKVENSMKAYKTELAKMYKAQYTFDDIKTVDAKMIQLKDVSKVVAGTDVTILLQGESGTGKELFAHAIHSASMNANEPFVSINCASIPSELLESELFGYESGAFTGAKKEGKVGKFELVGQGTLFLDELGTMPLDMQAKLLRVLESHEFERVGSNRKIAFNARVITATNENLETAVKDQTFRKDLYYRLNVVCLDIPPLRERVADIEFLCNNMIHNRRRKYNLEDIYISQESLQILKCHQWPGNVRELRNVMERATILCEGVEIMPEHLPEYIRKNAVQSVPEMKTGGYYKSEIARLEKYLITHALRECEGNRQKAARQLGIHRSVLYKKMKDLDIEQETVHNIDEK